MRRHASRARNAFVLCALASAIALQAGLAGAIPGEERTKASPSTIETRPAPPALPVEGQGLAPDTSMTLDSALQRGQWRRACRVAANALANQETNLDALGVFGMCSALRNDQAAASTALQRLREVEGAPPYYTIMTEGLLQLRNGAADKAEATFKAALQARPSDPLALYFAGEVQHQLKRDPQAIASFKAVLKRWPDHAPALASAARLLAAPSASKEDLKEAVAMTERATKIEPMNLDYWRQMAELYERAGQNDRAAAVKLQWLSPPIVPVVK